ncbi:hypothetical protein ALC53_04388 [Atta colombica]|uniref:Histone-lysine N-methyltransferase SETMAR n=1 Tax=Atta colombica TaxID=520822 RepID=A0A195BKF2_9HYME|nr:hypothetical protein ALC53_04388 [Atta colombica]
MLVEVYDVTVPIDRPNIHGSKIMLCIWEKNGQNEQRHDKVILLHDNARPHVASYSPDIAPSDYWFRRMQHDLASHRFTSFAEIENYFPKLNRLQRRVIFLRWNLYFPVVNLSDGDYELGLTDFETYHSISKSVNSLNNNFDEDYPDVAREKTLRKEDEQYPLIIHANNNTMKSEIKCAYRVNFIKPHNIGSLLGFSSNRVLEPQRTRIRRID